MPVAENSQLNSTWIDPGTNEQFAVNASNPNWVITQSDSGINFNIPTRHSFIDGNGDIEHYTPEGEKIELNFYAISPVITCPRCKQMRNLKTKECKCGMTLLKTLGVFNRGKYFNHLLMDVRKETESVIEANLNTRGQFTIDYLVLEFPMYTFGFLYTTHIVRLSYIKLKSEGVKIEIADTIYGSYADAEAFYFTYVSHISSDGLYVDIEPTHIRRPSDDIQRT